MSIIEMLFFENRLHFLHNNRSDFELTVSESDGLVYFRCCSKWKEIFKIHCKYFEQLCSLGSDYEDQQNSVWNLEMPQKDYDKNILLIKDFLEWADEPISYLWLGLNKNIIDFFTNELDYCVACDWTQSFEGNRENTPVYEALKNWKYSK